MGLISYVLTNTLSKLPGASHLGKWGWAAKGFSGLVAAGTLGASAHHAHYSFGHEYGSGTTAMYAVAGLHPITFIPMLILEGGKLIGDAAYQHQRAKRQSSFTKPPINDRFGTINRMRQYSHRQLTRDHTSKQRVLGNEASMLHR